MANILYLVHRIPYPPNKGDKLRSYHLLKHLAARHRVFLGTFWDDPEDAPYLSVLEDICVQCFCVRLHPAVAKIRSLRGLLTGAALTVPYYDDNSMRQWIARIVTENSIDSTVVFSSAMAQYAMELPELPMLVDFVDVDSLKWAQYAAGHSWPLSWLYSRESRRLLTLERALATRAKRSFFVTEKEVELFCTLAPEAAMRVEAMGNGVDSDYFSPDPARDSPFCSEQRAPIVFTGAMDYWPNIDAVTWFIGEVLPMVRRNWPSVRFYVVGRNPPDSLRLLASDGVVVTGTVSDVRPYLQHAAVVVAPLRVARGIQNKILEAMAMARPVVASELCVSALDAGVSAALLSAVEAVEFSDRVGELLASPERAEAVGKRGRKQVLEHYSWRANLAAIDPFLATRSTSDGAIRASQ